MVNHEAISDLDAFALLCELAIQDKQNVFSLIRLITTILLPEEAFDAPAGQTNAVPFRGCVYIRTSTYGIEDQTRKLSIRIEGPEGIKTPAQERDLVLKGSHDNPTAHSSLNIQLNLTLQVLEGTWWVVIDLDGQSWKKVPFRMQRA